LRRPGCIGFGVAHADADATAIGYAAPLITVVLAFFLLGEQVRLYRWSAVMIGFAGVLIILSDYFGPEAHAASGSIEIGAIFAITGAFASALAATQVRTLTRYEGAGTIVIYFSLLTSAAALATLPFGWIVPPPGMPRSGARRHFRRRRAGADDARLSLWRGARRLRRSTTLDDLDAESSAC
jgi:hypothetical protein